MMASQCILTLEQTEEYCAEWTRVSRAVARFKSDTDGRSITSRSLGFRPVTDVDDRQGCVVQ
ncbi:MAG: hypothetical protein P8R54_15890 [Myxococcota bacterium]|nr:hypothetical protein [Myxococcota bacterium]